jgi:hypothetical protein
MRQGYPGHLVSIIFDVLDLVCIPVVRALSRPHQHSTASGSSNTINRNGPGIQDDSMLQTISAVKSVPTP